MSNHSTDQRIPSYNHVKAILYNFGGHCCLLTLIVVQWAQRCTRHLTWNTGNRLFSAHEENLSTQNRHRDTRIKTSIWDFAFWHLCLCYVQNKGHFWSPELFCCWIERQRLTVCGCKQLVQGLSQHIHHERMWWLAFPVEFFLCLVRRGEKKSRV